MVEMVDTKFREPKPLKNLREALKELVASGKEALADGFQPGQDIPKIMLGSYAGFLKVLETFEQLDDSYKEELAASVKSNGVLAGDIIEVVLKDVPERSSAVKSGLAPEVAKKTTKKTSKKTA